MSWYTTLLVVGQELVGPVEQQLLMLQHQLPLMLLQTGNLITALTTDRGARSPPNNPTTSALPWPLAPLNSCSLTSGGG